MGDYFTCLFENEIHGFFAKCVVERTEGEIEGVASLLSQEPLNAILCIEAQYLHFTGGRVSLLWKFMLDYQTFLDERSAKRQRDLVRLAVGHPQVWTKMTIFVPEASSQKPSTWEAVDRVCEEVPTVKSVCMCGLVVVRLTH